jgi:DNA-directed RNA polymerase subunit beta
MRAQEILNNRKLSKDFLNIKSGNKIVSADLEKLNLNDYWKLSFAEEQANNDLQSLKQQFVNVKKDIKDRFEDKVVKIQQGDDLLPNVLKMVKVFVAVKRSLKPGDKMALN